MKIAKKVLSAVIALVIIMTVTVCSYADSNFNQAPANEANLVIGTVNITQAGDVTVPVNIQKNPGIYALNLQIRYDSNLTFKSISIPTAMGNYAGLTSSVENNVITVLVESVNNNSTSGISNFTATGTLLNIVFTSAYTKDSSFPVEFTKVDRQSVVNDTVQDITNSLSYCDGAVVCTTYVPTTAVAKPAKPVIKSVAYSAKNQIKITWNKALGATSYDVYRGSKKIKTVTGTSYKDTVKTAGTVKYIVAAKNAGGTTKSAEKSIKTMSFSAKATVKGTPAKKAVTVKITKKVKNAGGYEYSISLKKNMKSAKTKKTNKASFKFTKLKSKKVYYVRVRAYKKVGSKYIWGAYSKTVKVKKTK